MASAMHELFVLVQEHAKLVDGPQVQKLVSRLPEKPLKRWQTVVNVALDRDADDELAAPLLRLRNNFGFHYGAKAIAKGYEEFLASDNPTKDRAVFSVGNKMQTSRFYFADAAAEGAFKFASGRTRLEFEKEISPLLWDINEALHAIVTTYLADIGGAQPYAVPPPKTPAGSS